MTPKLFTRLVAYINRYVTFQNPDYATACALWVVGTYLWPHFDVFPYLVITSPTKRSGKTRLSEVLSFVDSNPRSFSAMTEAGVFRSIRDENPTLHIDEAETLASDSASMIRAVLNAGYRRGQAIPRFDTKKGIVEWPTYCPKIFILIGDPTDTLRDRAIVIRMKRAEPAERFTWAVASAEGQELREQIAEWAADHVVEAEKAYADHKGLAFLSDRDEEIWTPLFVVGALIAPDLNVKFIRLAADIAAEKTAPKLNHVNLQGEERAAEDEEFAKRLLKDLATVMRGEKRMFTADALKALKDLPEGPWRVFRGRGLTPEDMGHMLDRFDVHPYHVRIGGKGPNGKVKRGYKREEVRRGLDRHYKPAPEEEKSVKPGREGWKLL